MTMASTFSASGVDEAVEDWAFDVDPAGGGAALALTGEAHGGDGAHDGLLEVAIGEDDHWALAAELERDGDELLGGGLGDDAADLDGAGEGHLA